jgi:hypothetical protein
LVYALRITDGSDANPPLCPAACSRCRRCVTEGGPGWIVWFRDQMARPSSAKAGDREPMLWVLIDAKSVVATSEVLHEGMSGADASICIKIF